MNCFGDEYSVFDCSYNVLEDHICNYRGDARVQCLALDVTDNCTAGEIRLTEGQTRYEGLVEICWKNSWKSICPSSWDNSEAQVVCRQLGFTSIGASRTSTFGRSAAPINASRFSCLGSESALLNCNYYPYSCYSGRNYDASVRCEAPCTEWKIRLRGEDSHNSFGRVELCLNGTWGTICDNDWNDADASIVCKQLGYSPYGALAKTSYYAEGWLPHSLYNLNCFGNESTLFNCSYETSGVSCGSYDDAGAICQDINTIYSNCTDYDIRLVDGKMDNEGIIQICMNGVWGTFCFRDHYRLAANLICQEAGHNTGGDIYYAESPYASNYPILMEYINCPEYATNIKQCNLRYYTENSWCDVKYTAAINCYNCTNGNIRLQPYRSSDNSDVIGRVEVCIDGIWGAMCSEFFTHNDAQIVCKNLGHTALGSVSVDDLYYDKYIPMHAIYFNCTGNESNLLDCPFVTQGKECSDAASVACHAQNVEYSNCTNGQIRLYNETVTLQGRVEICYNNVWFGLCSENNYYSYYAAVTICKVIGYTHGSTPSFSISFLSFTNVPLFPYEFSCNEAKQSLLDCSKRINYCYFQHTGNYYKYLGVTCEEKCQHNDIRLSSYRYSIAGLVELCNNGHWEPVCGHSFDAADASVVCANLGYSHYGFAILPGYHQWYYNYNYNLWTSYAYIYDLNCTGFESNVFDCHYNNHTNYCPSSRSAMVLCQNKNATVDTSCATGDVRLVGGINEYEGRVEMCYNQMWGNVHHAYGHFGTDESNVVCKQLGHQSKGSIPLSHGYFGEGQAPCIFREIDCSNNENSLLECDRGGYLEAARRCSPYHATGVICLEPCTDNEVRLSGSSMDWVGRIELCVERTWTTLCDKTWDLKDAAVTCRQLGYSSYGAMPMYNCFTEGQLLFGITSIDCTGSENHILNCTHNGPVLYNCESHNDAGVICQETVVVSNCTDGELRLVDGSGPHEGRVEVCVNQVWGTICSIGWSNEDANVVCKQLGYLPFGGKARINSQYGPGAGPILMASVDCSGSEESILECSHRSCNIFSCSHYSDAGVTCERNCTNGDIRLGDESELKGRVEVCMNEIWSTICTTNWSQREASVICFQLGYSKYGALAASDVYINYEWPIGTVLGMRRYCGVVCITQEMILMEKSALNPMMHQCFACPILPSMVIVLMVISD